MTRSLTIGIVGCGAVVQSMYARTLIGREEYQVRFVHDRDAERAASTAATFGATAVGLDSLLDCVDAVIVATPPSTHGEIVGKALGRVSTVLCEKPFMPSSVQAQQLAECARRTGTRLCVGHFRRLFPQVRLARRLVEIGAIGTVVQIELSEGGRFTWSAASGYTGHDPHGGVLWDTGSHTLDMAMFVAQLDEVEGLCPVVDEVDRDRGEPSDDYRARFRLLAESHVVGGRIHVSRRESLPNYVTVRGTRGSIAFVSGLDDRLRLTTDGGSVVVRADESYRDILECLDLEIRTVLIEPDAGVLAAERFVNQIFVLEALSNEA